MKVHVGCDSMYPYYYMNTSTRNFYNDPELELTKAEIATIKKADKLHEQAQAILARAYVVTP